MDNDMMEKLIDLEGYRIKFNTYEGDYEGTIAKIEPEIQLLFIKKLIWLPKNSKMGTLTFRAKEIKSFDVISQEEVPQPNPPEPSYGNNNIFTRETELPTLYYDDIEMASSISDSEVPSEFDLEEKEFELALPPSIVDLLPIDHVVIDEINDDFSDAIRHMKRQDMIGISLESPKIGRHEELQWLCISTVCCTFLFDVHRLGKEGFSSGLKEILENPGIEKVLHDCRLACDCLYHQYDTRLVNVYDTQVANFIINQQRKKDCRINKHVNPLNSCLGYYLDIPDEFLYRRKKRSYQDDLVFYGLRPVTDDLRNLFIKNVIYLRLLKKKVDACLMEPMTKYMNIYLHTFMKRTDREFQVEDFTPNIVPEEVLSERVQVFRFHDHVDIPKAVSSGPPYRPIVNMFKDYIEYCKKHGIGEIDNKLER